MPNDVEMLDAAMKLVRMLKDHRHTVAPEMGIKLFKAWGRPPTGSALRSSLWLYVTSGLCIVAAKIWSLVAVTSKLLPTTGGLPSVGMWKFIDATGITSLCCEQIISPPTPTLFGR